MHVSPNSASGRVSLQVTRQPCAMSFWRFTCVDASYWLASFIKGTYAIQQILNLNEVILQHFRMRMMGYKAKQQVTS